MKERLDVSGNVISRYISLLWGTVPSQPILTIADMFGNPACVNRSATFHINLLKVFGHGMAETILIPTRTKSSIILCLVLPRLHVTLQFQIVDSFLTEILNKE
jgi:hypothetical protein